MKSIDHAIFLHRSPYSSSSLLVTFFTQNKGLQKFIFKGGKKKSFNLFPLSYSEINYYGRNSDLLSLTDVEPVFPQTFQFNPLKSSIAFFVCEVARKCVQAEDSDEQLFLFLKEFSRQLELSDDLQLFPLLFLIGLSDKLGILPLVEEEDMRVFNLDRGVFQHTKSQSERTFSGEGVSLIIQLISEEEDIVLPNKEVREEALKIMLNYYSIHIPRFEKLDSYEILKEVLS